MARLQGSRKLHFHFFFFNDTATTEIYTLSLHDALPISPDDGNPHKHWYFLGGSLVMWCAWQLSSGVGIFAGAMIPSEWSLEFASTLALIALLIPLLFDRAVAWGALAAGAVALIAARLPLNLGLLAAIAVGVAVGLAVTRLGPRKEEGRG